MPKGSSGPGRGGKRNHKGQRRMFTNEEELAHQHEQEEKKRAWRKQKGIESDEEEDEEKSEGDGSSSSESDSDDDANKNKGVSHLIDIENPNRVSSKSSKKVTEMVVEGGSAGGPQNLSRREREEIEKQQAKIRYQQLHVQGKTDEARADLARLALIKKQREEAAKKREEAAKAKDTTTKNPNRAKGKS